MKIKNKKLNTYLREPNDDEINYALNTIIDSVRKKQKITSYILSLLSVVACSIFAYLCYFDGVNSNILIPVMLILFCLIVPTMIIYSHYKTNAYCLQSGQIKILNCMCDDFKVKTNYRGLTKKMNCNVKINNKDSLSKRLKLEDINNYLDNLDEIKNQKTMLVSINNTHSKYLISKKNFNK